MKKLFQMKNSRLLNNIKLLIILFFLLFTFGSHSEEEPADIWNVEAEQQKKKKRLKMKKLTQKVYLKIVYIKCNLKTQMN